MEINKPYEYFSVNSSSEYRLSVPIKLPAGTGITSSNVQYGKTTHLTIQLGSDSSTESRVVTTDFELNKPSNGDFIQVTVLLANGAVAGENKKEWPEATVDPD